METDTDFQWNHVCKAGRFEIQQWGESGDMRALRHGLLESRIVTLTGEARDVTADLARELAKSEERIEAIRGWFTRQITDDDVEAESILSGLEEEGLL